MARQRKAAKPDREIDDSFDDEMLFDDEFDVDGFIETMERKTTRRRRRNQKKSAWSRLEDIMDERRLRKELQDFDADF